MLPTVKKKKARMMMRKMRTRMIWMIGKRMMRTEAIILVRHNSSRTIIITEDSFIAFLWTTGL